MCPQTECVATVKEVTAEVMRENNALVERLNAMNQRITEEEDPVTKVRRKVEWAAERDRSVEALNKIVASLQNALDEEDGMTEMSPTARSKHGSTATSRSSSASNAASRPHGAASPSFTRTHASCEACDQTDFEITVAAGVDPDFSFGSSQEAGAAEPHQMKCRSSPSPLRKLRKTGADDAGRAASVASSWAPSTPQRKLATCPLPSTPHRQLPALLDKDGGEHISSPASKAAGFLLSLSSEASLLPQQVRKSLKMRARRFSASMLQRVGWNPVHQRSESVWDFSV